MGFITLIGITVKLYSKLKSERSTEHIVSYTLTYYVPSEDKYVTQEVSEGADNPAIEV